MVVEQEQVTQSYPRTIVIRDPRERTQKCSIYPLRGREDFFFINYPPKHPPALDGYVRLAPEGPELSAADAANGLLLIDASWRWSRKLTRDFLEVPPRSLTGFQTAFPRVSKLGVDPENGLASVEAIYVAYLVLGRPTAGLLDQYRWAEQFLALNGFDKDNEL